MNLILDIGNTRTKIGIFDHKTLLEKKAIANSAFNITALQGILHDFEVRHIILTNSGEVNPTIIQYLEAQQPITPFIYLSADTPIPIRNNYGTPNSLGKDRLSAAVAAAMLYPNENVLAIDCGTCITYNFITADAAFEGGNITPGLTMRLEAMHRLTAKLPLIERGTQGDLIGKNTETAIRTGAQYGAIFEMQGFIDAYLQRFSTLRTLLTGGDADYFGKHLKNKIFAHENLVLIGLNEILLFNHNLAKP